MGAAVKARAASAVVVAFLAFCPRVRADGPSSPPPTPAMGDAQILSPIDNALHIESIMTRISGFDQFGHGWQAQGGPTPTAPGSERATILEPQAEIDATQGARLKHRIWVPVDIVSNASPHAIDVLSSASRHVESGSIDWAATYQASPVSDATILGGIHLENPFRSWQGGLAGSRAFADGDTVVSVDVLEVFDWFDRFDIHGTRHGRAERSSATASLGITQILTPTTIVNLNYGVTVQRGEMGNTWNSVSLATGERGPELLPDERVRHAVVARAAQFLPWNGALHVSHRFYADDWGLSAHSTEAELMQRISPFVYVGALYRFHTQTGVTFFTKLADPSAGLRTADSDLAPLDSQTVGGKVVVDVPADPPIRTLHFEFGYDRYVRTNDLHINVVTCATGYRF
jgi:hypothetical protein